MTRDLLHLAIRLAIIREQLGEDAYAEAVRRSEVAVARLALEIAERRARERPDRMVRAKIIRFPQTVSDEPGAKS